MASRRRRFVLWLPYLQQYPANGARPVLEVNVADVTPVDSYGTEKTTKLYSQGQLVKYQGDTFHALYDVDSCDGTMDIISIYNLNSTGTAQVNDTYSNTACAFSSSQYWSDVNQNINNIPGGDTDVTYCVPRIKKYALDKGALNGRLLTYEEANTIKSGTNDTAKDMLWGRQNTAQLSSGKGYLEYWLGSSGKKNALEVYQGLGNYSLWGIISFSDSYVARSSPSVNSQNIRCLSGKLDIPCKWVQNDMKFTKSDRGYKSLTKTVVNYQKS